jgi:hypothetical protein
MPTASARFPVVWFFIRQILNLTAYGYCFETWSSSC